MPFGISEIFQCCIHQLIEGLKGIKVIADDFVAIGCGDTYEEALLDHDKNLRELLQWCKERNVCLNADKIKFRMQEIPFVGQIDTKEGLCVDPGKVQGIIEMPPPKDVAAKASWVLHST